MSLSGGELAEAARQMAMFYMFRDLTQDHIGNANGRIEDGDRKISCYSPEEKATAWALIRAIFQSVRRLEMVDKGDMGDLPGRYWVLSRFEFENMLRAAGETDRTRLDLLFGVPVALRDHLHKSILGWKTAKIAFWDGMFDNAPSMDSLSEHCDAKAFTQTIPEIFRKVSSEAENGVFGKCASADEFTCRAFRSLVLEAASLDGGVGELWHLENPAMPGHVMAIVPLAVALGTLEAAPLLVLKLRQEGADGLDELTMAQLKEVSEYSTYQAGDLAGYVQLLEQATGKPVQFAK